MMVGTGHSAGKAGIEAFLLFRASACRLSLKVEMKGYGISVFQLNETHYYLDF
ncbi:MAG: hypothetical protein IKA37_02025 [Spirochaetales bacterium]|nr:hypothetical protein [Spirochaetales bacterium]